MDKIKCKMKTVHFNERTKSGQNSMTNKSLENVI